MNKSELHVIKTAEGNYDINAMEFTYTDLTNITVQFIHMMADAEKRDPVELAHEIAEFMKDPASKAAQVLS